MQWEAISTFRIFERIKRVVENMTEPICTSITPSLFRSRLKTYFFHKSYPPCARLSWPSLQLIYRIISYHIVSYRIVSHNRIEAEMLRRFTTLNTTLPVFMLTSWRSRIRGRRAASSEQSEYHEERTVAKWTM